VHMIRSRVGSAMSLSVSTAWSTWSSAGRPGSCVSMQLTILRRPSTLPWCEPGRLRPRGPLARLLADAGHNPSPGASAHLLDDGWNGLCREEDAHAEGLQWSGRAALGRSGVRRPRSDDHRLGDVLGCASLSWACGLCATTRTTSTATD